MFEANVFKQFPAELDLRCRDAVLSRQLASKAQSIPFHEILHLASRGAPAYPISSWLWIIAFFRILYWSPWKKGVVVVCGHRKPHRKAGLRP